GEGCLPSEPDDLATLRDDGWRESARFLKIRAFQMDHGAVCCHWLKISRHVSRAEIKLRRSPRANNRASPRNCPNWMTHGVGAERARPRMTIGGIGLPFSSL